jgi:hypothetical protein
MPNAMTQLVVGHLLSRGVFYFSRGVGKDVFRNFFGAENILRQQVEAEIKKKDESRDCSQDREKGKRRRDYSQMVRFFDGRLFSAHGVFPLSAMALGVFPGEGGREGVK